MKYSDAISNLGNISDIIDCLDIILYSRPVPHREYDQIYMKARSLLEQVEYVREYINGKKVVFLGDGDGMSILLALLSQKYPLGINELTVFDFDTRILNVFESIRTQQKLDIPMSFNLYNVINPVDSYFYEKYDFFYINPPYGSKNKGLSCILWIIRCMELTTINAEGCIIIPDDETMPWTIDCANEIYAFLERSGFQIIKSIKNIHQYHLDDNPTLLSSMIIVRRTEWRDSTFKGKKFPLQMCKNLYGSTRAIPQYIYESKLNPYGVCDFGWEYGEIDNFSI